MADEPFIVYSYVGAAARAIDEHTAEGILELRPELRHAGGLLAAPLGLMSTSGTGVTVHIHAAGAPTRIDVHMYESGDGVQRVKVDTKLLRVGRSQVFAEARFTDADNPSRQLGYSTVSYVATGPGTGKLATRVLSAAISFVSAAIRFSGVSSRKSGSLRSVFPAAISRSVA